MKLLDCGVAVLVGDTHISSWVIDHNRLDIAEEMLRPFHQYVPEGGTVIDVGASIGDHTITYAQWVGKDGLVAAFEPHAQAYECLLHNTKHLPQVLQVQCGLSDTDGEVGIVMQDNSGASYITESEGGISVAPLDSYEFDAHFIKIDVEGYEVRVLRGAEETINRCRPVMLIEVNSTALERAGSSQQELIELILSYGYNISMIDSRIPWSDPQYDVLCLPTEKAH